MNREQRQRQMLASLPLLLQEGANLGELCSHLARMMSGEPDDCAIEYGVSRLLRSRWHSLAQGWRTPTPEARAASELGRIGALFGFPPARAEQVDAFRRRLVEFVAIHRAGLTTAPAILRLVALVYQAEATPTITWNIADRSARATFMARGPGGERREVRVDLIDNPSAPSSVHFAKVPANRRLTVTNGGLDPALPELRLRPQSGPARVPVFIHSDSGLRLIYVGVVKDGDTLTLRHRRPALINGIPQPGTPVLLTNPFVFDGETSRFTGPDHVGARFSVAERDSSMPSLVPGESTWIYNAMARNELAAFLSPWPNLVKLATLADEVPAAPDADIELRWDESVPASVALRVPADHVPHAFEIEGELGPERRLAAFVRELEWALNYGRAAGIRARVELALPQVSEALELSDALGLRVDLPLAEAQPIGEVVPAPTAGIHIVETLPETNDPLYFGGLFDTTLFETSLFQ
ncbi:hypothetical protein [Nannocystis sp.]|uniref:hypothetical protein n=1 Tax=Nannocystis sp. TaxID=1962667 RepID=UPI00242092D1|nr:hypothetical protein [Nannocystis sp.]MBK7828163.1 hypothetical protein [Nannocystis sp.]MBK9753602.1 hypothetical protein [Nannocystis sp.]